MGAASVGPTEGEGFFVTRAALKEEFVLRIEEEDAECSVRH